MMKILILISLNLVFNLTNLFAQQTVNQMDITDYLKSKFLGKSLSQKYDNGAVIRQKIVNVVEEEEGIYAVLSNFEKVKISFKTSLVINPTLIQKNVTQKNHVDLSVLKAEEMINKGIQKTLSQSNMVENSSSLTNLEKNIDQFKQRNDFTTSKKIIYTDIKSKKEISDYFVITHKGLYLMNGTKLVIIIK